MSPQPSFSPSEILPSTISELLALYPATARAVYQAKLEAKSKNSKQDIEKQVQLFLELDRWRYEELPAIISKRAAELHSRPAKRAKTASDATEIHPCGLQLNKDEGVRLMEWKLKHGSMRPALMNLIRSNSEADVHSSTSEALASLPVPISSDEEDESPVFPQAAIEQLTNLRGVGPATASLFLSACTAGLDLNQTPFFSDEMYWWLCSLRFPSITPTNAVKVPGASPKLKYTLKEYKELWESARDLRTRFKKMGGTHTFSMQDIEQVAFVIGHLEHSGYQSPNGNTESPLKTIRADGKEGVKKSPIQRTIKEEAAGESTRPRRSKRKLGE